MPDEPNVLFVFCDQMRAEAMGCMGNEQVHTPTLDRVADEGVLCTRNYTPAPVCTPAKSSILTGQYPHTHGNIANNFRLPADATTLANVLGDAGYETGYIGLWHLDGTAKPGYVPPERRQGFEYWRGFNRGMNHFRGHPHLGEDGDVEWEEGYQPAVQTDLAIDFIDEHAGDDPFFCYTFWCPPHLPYEAPAEHRSMYDADELELRPNVPDRMAKQARRDLVDYYGMISAIDDQLERLLDALEERGIADETIVVFGSDHGDLLGSHGRYYKGEPLEESIHVPLLWRFPGVLPEGRECEELTSLVDLFPTVCSLCDVEAPPSVQGEDLSGALRGEGGTDRDGVYIGCRYGGEDEWRAFRTEDHALVVDRHGEARQFFNTADDPYQQHNLVDLKHDKPDLERKLVDAAKEFDDRYFLAQIGERAH